MWVLEHGNHSKRLQKQKQIVQHDKITNGKAIPDFPQPKKAKVPRSNREDTALYLYLTLSCCSLFMCWEIESNDIVEHPSKWLQARPLKILKEPNVSMSLIPNKEKHQHISKPSEPSVPSHWVILQPKPESQHIWKHKSAATANLQCFFRNQHSKTRKLKQQSVQRREQAPAFWGTRVSCVLQRTDRPEQAHSLLPPSQQ